MINLAGVRTCNDTIRDELMSAEIPIIELGSTLNGEVPTNLIGYLNGFKFERAWSYWVVSGYMPLRWANYLYDNYRDLSIRVCGHCGNPAPEGWEEPKELQKKIKPLFDKYMSKEISKDEFEEKANVIRKQGDQFITYYHIDSQSGLCMFSKVVREQRIVNN